MQTGLQYYPMYLGFSDCSFKYNAAQQGDGSEPPKRISQDSFEYYAAARSAWSLGPTTSQPVLPSWKQDKIHISLKAKELNDISGSIMIKTLQSNLRLEIYEYTRFKTYQSSYKL